MTSNNAISFNNKTMNARTFHFTTLLEFIRFTLKTWFFDREEISHKLNTKLISMGQHDLANLNNKAQYVTSYGLGLYECHFKDEIGDIDVYLMAKTCTCGLPKQLGIPCEHAITSVQH